MHNLPISVRHISDAYDLFYWLIPQMEDTKPRVFIPRELSDRCEEFLDQLMCGRPIVIVPVTMNAIRRAHSLSVNAGGVQESTAMLNFLGSIGHWMERSKQPTVLTIDDLVVCALKSWPGARRHVSLTIDRGTAYLSCTGQCVLQHGVMFEMALRPTHPWYPLTRSKFYYP